MLVTFIADLNLLVAFLGIIALLPTAKFLEQIGIYAAPISGFLDTLIRILIVIINLSISYGYFKLKRWGYFVMLTSNLLFLVLSIIILVKPNINLYTTPSLISSALGLILTFPSKRYFIKEAAVS
jgi:uncharacterized membrane protein (DUF2068 family)